LIFYPKTTKYHGHRSPLSILDEEKSEFDESTDSLADAILSELESADSIYLNNVQRKKEEEKWSYIYI